MSTDEIDKACAEYMKTVNHSDDRYHNGAEDGFKDGYNAGHSAKIDEIADRAALHMSLSRHRPGKPEKIDEISYYVCGQKLYTKVYVEKLENKVNEAVKVIEYYANNETTMQAENGLYFRDGIDGKFEPYKERAREFLAKLNKEQV